MRPRLTFIGWASAVPSDFKAPRLACVLLNGLTSKHVERCHNIFNKVILHINVKVLMCVVRFKIFNNNGFEFIVTSATLKTLSLLDNKGARLSQLRINKLTDPHVIWNEETLNKGQTKVYVRYFVIHIHFKIVYLKLQ